MRPNQFTSIGGQAVIEGVMMRSPHFIAVAVRKPNQKIIVKNNPYRSIVQILPWLKRPILRGVITLVESMVQGIEALSYSANIAAESEKPGERLSSWAIAGSIASAFVLGMALFVALPHFLTALFTSNRAISVSAESPIFHLLDGFLKMLILLVYVYAIALMKDIRRVFQYHGAEHKSIYAFEAGEELTVENAKKYPNLHPRCGTSFLLFLIVISILVFSVIFPLFNLTSITPYKFLNHVLMVFLKIVLMFPVAGLAYEFIKMCASRMQNPVFKTLIWPGMVLQKLTTREPTDDQIDVALASLRQVLNLEKTDKNAQEKPSPEFEIGNFAEISYVKVNVAEFPEA